MKEPRVLTTLKSRLSKAVKKYGVPGAAVAVLKGRKVYEAAAGVLNVDTGVEATTDSIFQIGSITKTFTGTLTMQLVDQRRLKLDEPVVSYLPDFMVCDRDVTKKVTIRHLLTHTSGIDGDFFVDAGRGEDRIARYVDKCALLPQVHPIGRSWSYCNAGFNILGRVLEVVSGRTWDELMRERVFEPLGMDHATTLPEETVVFRTAVGHLPDLKKEGAPMVTPVPYIQACAAPAGSSTAMTAADLLRYARMHLEDGAGRKKGERVVSQRSAVAMRETVSKIPWRTPELASAMGLSFLLYDWDGTWLYGHDGGTVGQYAFLRILPRPKMAVALLTNGGDARGLYREIHGAIFSSLAGIRPVQPPKPAKKISVDLGRFTGVYENVGSRTEVTAVDGRLNARVVSKLWDVMPPMEFPLLPVDHELFVVMGPDGKPLQSVHFGGFDDAGTAQVIFNAGRMANRIR